MKTSFLILLVFLLLTYVNCETPAAVKTETPTPTEKPAKVPMKGEKHVFQAEISKLLGIIINSLYTDKEIFLRELISNASDALDKIRYASLTDKAAFDVNPKLEIRIKADKEGKTLTITDTGVGMTRADLTNNLGTLAKSGTKEFIEKLQKTSDYSLIGKFGVGFYSAFVVAHKVTVASKHHDDDQFIWESEADNSFVIRRDPRGNSLKRGTEITLHLKEKVGKEYMDQYELKNLISKYSEFTHFPIYLYTERTETKEVPIEEPKEEEEKKEEEKKETEEKKEDGEEIKVEEEKKEEEEKKPKTKKVEELIKEWKHVNDIKPIWKRESKSITEEEYNKFYKKVGNDYMDPMTYTHFKVEGNVDFTALLYVPSKAPFDNQRMSVKDGKIKLYVRRVFIKNLSQEFFPQYLNWISGVVDSNDIPLHISRQDLQRTKILNVIKKKLVKKILQMLARLAQEEEEEVEQWEKDKAEEKKDLKDPKRKYTQFFKEFEQKIKLGVIEDEKNQKKIMDLVRFRTSATGDDEYISFEKYVSRMKKEQKQIYYLTAASLTEAKNSPYMERLKGLEVIYFTSPIDEYMINRVKDYDGKTFQSISKEGLKIEKDEEKQKALETDFETVTKKFTDVLGKKIEKVVINDQINSSPVVLVASEKSVTSNMERIMLSQTLNDKRRLQYMEVKKILEVNPNHQVIVQLKSLVETADETTITNYINLLFETAMLRSGYKIDDTKILAGRIFDMMNNVLSQNKVEKNDEVEKVKENIEKKVEEEEKTSDDKDEL